MDASDSPRRLMAIEQWKPTDCEIVAHDCHAMVAHDCHTMVAHDRHTIVAQDHRTIDGPRSSCDRGHQSAFHRIKWPTFLMGIPL